MAPKAHDTEEFLIPSGTSSASLKERINETFALRSESSTRGEVAFFDTFDWLLFNNNLSLSRVGNSFRLSSYPNGEVLLEQPWQKRKVPAFWWDFPEGPLRERIRPVIDVRAIVSVLTLTRDTEVVQALNDDEKIVLRLQFEESIFAASPVWPRASRSITLFPLRGYEDERNEVATLCKRLHLTPSNQHLLERMLVDASKRPGDYSSKLDIALEPGQTAETATKCILLDLLNTMGQNEAGIKADIDSEFLHDFRVAIRRTRSALAQIKGVIPDNYSTQFKSAFASLGQMTNRLRDLDVYLLKEESYRGMLPESLRAGLDPMFAALVRERKREQKRLARALESDPYQQTVGDWRRFLSEETPLDEAAPANAHLPIGSLSRKYIHKRYLRILKRGKRLSPESPDERLHDLRIECKKLRYLLEFFKALYPTDKVAILIKQLKGLQDNLGEFNDLCVQQEDLQGYLQGSKLPKQDSRCSAAAIGGLIAVLYQRQQRIRSQFSQAYARFSATDNMALFQELFG